MTALFLVTVALGLAALWALDRDWDILAGIVGCPAMLLAYFQLMMLFF